MLWKSVTHRRIVQLVDGTVTAASIFVAFFIWNWSRLNITSAIGRAIEFDQYYFGIIIATSIVWVFILTKIKAYSYQRFTSLTQEFSIVFKSTTIGVFILFGAIFLVRLKYIPRTFVFVFAIVNFLLLAVEKTILFKIAKHLRLKGLDRKNILVVGTGNETKKFIRIVDMNFGWGLDVIGLLSSDEKKKGQRFFGKTILGSYSDIEEILHKKIPDEVIICIPCEDFAALKKLMESCEKEGVQVRLNSDFFGHLAKSGSVDFVYGLPFVSFYSVFNNEWSLLFKRLFDISVSSILMFLLFPVYLAIGILVKFSSEGPIIYEWNVVGLNKKPFKSWKFRSMQQDADKLKSKLQKDNIMNGPVFKIKNDPRVTKIGKFLRKHSLDELPQLWSVLKGDMSLVGPRPAGPHELKRYENWHRRKLSVKPGITCLWQVKGRSKITDFDEWARLDLEYIDNWSFWLDLKILFKTIRKVISGDGAY